MNILNQVAKLAVSFALGITVIPATAATYYLSAKGSDSHSYLQAQNPLTPWRTLDKLRRRMYSLQPGDSVLFRRGDVFYGRLRITVSGQAGAPIVFSAYGTGAAPIIDGSVALTDWQSAGAHRWHTAFDPDFSATEVQLYQDSNCLPLGRFPNRDEANGGYLTIDQGLGRDRFIGSGVPDSVIWEGGEVVVRSSPWTLDRSPILQHESSTFTLGRKATYTIPKHFGFFIQNHPATLDQVGEWCYEAGQRRITWHADSGQVARPVYVAHHPHALDIRNQQYVTVRQLAFRRTRKSNVYVWKSRHVLLHQVESRQGVTDGLRVLDSKRITLDGCRVDQNANNGLVAKNGELISVRNSSFTETGTVAGRGSNGNGTYNAMVLTGNNIYVRNNTITKTGYVGIDFRGTNMLIKNNTVSHFCTLKDDGGGIYSWAKPEESRKNLRVIGNVVLYGGGGEIGTNRPEKSAADGIYLDDRTHEMTVGYNTVAHCGGSGIYVHNAQNVQLRYNTLYNNRIQLRMINNAQAATEPASRVRNCQVFRNVLVGLNPQQPLMELLSIDEDVTHFGTFDENRYLQPFHPRNHVRVAENIGTPQRSGRDLSLAQWQAFAQQDSLSTLSPRHYEPVRVLQKEGENMFANAGFDSTITEWTRWARYGNAQISWQEEGDQDPGSLRAGFTTLLGQGDATLLLIGQHQQLNIRAGTYYRLRLRTRGTTEDQPVKVFLRRSGRPDYCVLAASQTLYTSLDWQDHTLVFRADSSSTSGRLDLQLTEDDGDLWIDHVSLQPVEVQPASPGDSVQLVHNTEAITQHIPLVARSVGPTNRVYPETITLAPYTSSVLLKAPPAPLATARTGQGKEATAAKTADASDDQTLRALPLSMYPNPAHQRVTLAYDMESAGSAHVTLTNAQGQTVHQVAQTKAKGAHTVTLSLTQLSRGWYIVRVVTADQVRYGTLLVR